MKTILLLTSAAVLFAFSDLPQKGAQLKGAWEWKTGNEIHTVIFSEGFYAVTEYSVADKKFITTYGGSYAVKGNEISLVEEFNSGAPQNIGTSRSVSLKAGNKSLALAFTEKHKDASWTKVDAGEPGKLAGAWLITGRVVDSNMQKITPGVRRTMKILSGTRFQWIAYNTETKEFFGTGGGTYTSENGKYVENIFFFSRDNSRVGKSLEFDFSLEEGKWRHKGFSSKGDPIDEIWTRRELIGL